MTNRTVRDICVSCYKKYGLKWSDRRWKRACKSEVAWQCPYIRDIKSKGVFPPFYCEHRAEIMSLKKKNKMPVQTEPSE